MLPPNLHLDPEAEDELRQSSFLYWGQSQREEAYQKDAQVYGWGNLTEGCQEGV